MLTLRRIAKGGISRISRGILVALSSGARGKKLCNACGKNVAGFYRYGGRPFGCPFCRSSTRERFVKYAIDSKLLNLPAEASGILHVAPNERSLVRYFSQYPDYRPVDLFPELYREANATKFDLMQQPEPGSFSLVYLSHVMEHVPDDHLVLKNLHHALKPGGEGWFLIPMWDKPSRDGTPNMSAAEREREFGQWDHARMYGPDFAERLERAGFEVTIFKAEETPREVQELHGFQKLDWIFRALKTSV